MPAAEPITANIKHEIMKAVMLHSRFIGSFEHIPTENSEYGKNNPNPLALKAKPKIPPTIEIPIGAAKLSNLRENVSCKAIIDMLPIEPKISRSINLNGIGSVNPAAFPEI